MVISAGNSGIRRDLNMSRLAASYQEDESYHVEYRTVSSHRPCLSQSHDFPLVILYPNKSIKSGKMNHSCQSAVTIYIEQIKIILIYPGNSNHIILKGQGLKRSTHFSQTWKLTGKSNIYTFSVA